MQRSLCAMPILCPDQSISFFIYEGEVGVGHARELLKLHGTKQNRLCRTVPRAH